MKDMALCLRRFGKALGSLSLHSCRKHSTYLEQRTAHNVVLSSMNKASCPNNLGSHGTCPNTPPLVTLSSSNNAINWDQEFQNCLDSSKDRNGSNFRSLELARFTRSEILLSQEAKVEENVKQRASESQLQHIQATLAHDLPKLFTRAFNYTIYHRDIVLENNIKGYKSVGLVQYAKQLALFRTVAAIRFSSVVFIILKMTTHTEDSTVKVRWQIRTMPGLFRFWKIGLWGTTKEEAIQRGQEWYDGFSTYYVSGDGKVHRHIIDKVMPDNDTLSSNISKTILGAKVALFTGIQNPDIFHSALTCNQLLSN